MRVNDILDDILELAKAIAPIVPMGAEAKAAAELAMALLDKINDKEPSRDIDQVREQLQSKLDAMNEHADSTIARLRGEPEPE